MQSLILTVFLSTIVSTGFCLKCFQCNSAEDRECINVHKNDTGSPFYKNCTGNYEGQDPFCRKLIYTILEKEPETRVIRSCGWLMEFGDKKKDKCKKGDTDFILKRSCHCFTEGCNFGTNLKPQFLAKLIVLLSCLANYFN